MFTPRTTRFPAALRRSFARRGATWSAPSLLKPMRLRSARCSGIRNRRGRSLPTWPWAVTVPTSTKPNPIAASPVAIVAFLSNPAAIPSGEAISRPKTSVRYPAGPRPSRRRTTGASTGVPARVIALAALWCARSGSTFVSARSTICWYTPIIPPCGSPRRVGTRAAAEAQQGMAGAHGAVVLGEHFLHGIRLHQLPVRERVLPHEDPFHALGLDRDLRSWPHLSAVVGHRDGRNDVHG